MEMSSPGSVLRVVALPLGGLVTRTRAMAEVPAVVPLPGLVTETVGTSRSLTATMAKDTALLLELVVPLAVPLLGTRLLLLPRLLVRLVATLAMVATAAMAVLRLA